jgi:hypothetical protein
MREREREEREREKDCACFFKKKDRDKSMIKERVYMIIETRKLKIEK